MLATQMTEADASHLGQLVQGGRGGSVHLQVRGGEVGHQRRHGPRLPEQRAVRLQLAAVADRLRQLRAQLVVTRVRQLGQLEIFST